MRILHWFRKDLRLDDNSALSEAVRDADGDVVPFYASEPALLERPDMAPARVRFVLDALASLSTDVRALGSTLALAHGDAVATVLAAAVAAGAQHVYFNDEYEPQLRRRDDDVARALRAAGIGVKRFHDRLLVPPGAVATQSGTPYTVYTPFRRACEALPISSPLPRVTRLAAHDLPAPPLASLAQLGFAEVHTARWPAGERAARERLARVLAATAGDAGLAHDASHPPRRRRHPGQLGSGDRQEQIHLRAALARFLCARAVAFSARGARLFPS